MHSTRPLPKTMALAIAAGVALTGAVAPSTYVPVPAAHAQTQTHGMEPALIKAHDKLDHEIDAVFGLTGAVDDEQRQQALFEHYKAMTE